MYCLNIKFVDHTENPQIEKAFPKLPKDTSEVTTFCEANKLDQKTVFKYLWNRKRNTVMKAKISKFSEASWRLTFYAYFCYIGYRALFTPTTASWIQDTHNHWIGWPYHVMSEMVEYYYQVELGSYIHQLLWTEVSRSDSLQMILHHLTTIALMVFSYLSNYTRIGASILLLHDTADVFLEGAKVSHYISQGAKGKFFRAAGKIGADVLFVIFAVTFFVTRLMLYPRYIVYSAYVESMEIFGTYSMSGYFVFTGLLTILQLLHVFWFYLIARMIYGMVTDKLGGDVRSDDDEDDLGEFNEDKAKATLVARKKKQ